MLNFIGWVSRIFSPTTGAVPAARISRLWRKTAMRIAHVIETQQLRDARPLITDLSLAAMIAISPARAQWQPSRNIEIIAPAAAGSSLDSMARLLQRVIQDKRWRNRGLTVVNKAGGGNAGRLQLAFASPCSRRTLRARHAVHHHHQPHHGRQSAQLPGFHADRDARRRAHRVRGQCEFAAQNGARSARAPEKTPAP